MSKLKPTLKSVLESMKKPVPAFCALCILGLLTLLGTAIVTHGEIWHHFFYYDVRDTGMDFFHSIEYVKNRMPYEEFAVLYPPLANIIFYALYLLIPDFVTVQWPSDFSMSIGLRGTDVDLRTWQATMIVFLIFVVAMTVVLFLMVECLNLGCSIRQMRLLAVCSVFSYGLLYALERGNIIVLSLILALFFVQYRNSENPVVKELALIALAVSAGIKLYPAFFGVLLIRDRRWKEAARAVIYGVAALILPFFFFKEGLGGMPLWIETLTSFGLAIGEVVDYTGSGFTNLLAHLLSSAAGITLINTRFISLFGYLCAGVILLCSLFAKKEWQAVAAQAIALICIEPQANYIFCFMLIPLMSLFKEEETLTWRNIVPFLCMAFMCAPFPYCDYLASYVRISQFTAIALSVCSVIWAAAGIVSARRNKILTQW